MKQHKEYCEQDHIQSCHWQMESPINSRSIFKVKFDLSDQEAFGKTYVSEIKKLYNKVKMQLSLKNTAFKKKY